jgi:hypothetical protein
VLVLAVPEHFVSLGTRAELIRMNGLDGAGIAAAVIKVLPPVLARFALDQVPQRFSAGSPRARAAAGPVSGPAVPR